jgi:HK97 gp10 family phage protein
VAGTQGTVYLSGLKELRRALLRFDNSRDAAWKQLWREGNKAAGQIYVDEAKRRVPVGNSGRRGHLRDTIRATSRGVNAVIKAGSKRHPYAALVEFGHASRYVQPWGRVTRGGRPQAVFAPMPSQPFMYPAIEAKREKATREYVKQLERVLARAFLSV